MYNLVWVPGTLDITKAQTPSYWNPLFDGRPYPLSIMLKRHNGNCTALFFDEHIAMKESAQGHTIDDCILLKPAEIRLSSTWRYRMPIAIACDLYDLAQNEPHIHDDHPNPDHSLMATQQTNYLSFADLKHILSQKDSARIVASIRERAQRMTGNQADMLRAIKTIQRALTEALTPNKLITYDLFEKTAIKQFVASNPSHLTSILHASTQHAHTNRIYRALRNYVFLNAIDINWKKIKELI